MRYASFNAQILQRYLLALVNYHNSVSSVHAVFRLRHPSTVSGFIPLVVVDSINRQAFWARTHIGQELSERVPPSFTHKDSASAIVFVLLVGWIVASFFRSTPRDISGGASLAMDTAFDAAEAAATFGVSALQGSRSTYEYGLSAIASTLPYSGMISDSGESDYREHSESLTGNIFKFSDWIGKFLVSHVASLLGAWLEPRSALIAPAGLA